MIVKPFIAGFYWQLTTVSLQNAHLLKTSSALPSQATINYFGVMKENIPHFNEALRNILIPRVPGTKGNEIVRNVRFLFHFFQKHFNYLDDVKITWV